MNSQEQILVGCRANDIGSKEEFPGEKGRGTKEVGTDDLNSHNQYNKVFCQRFRTAELQDLEVMS